MKLLRDFAAGAFWVALILHVLGSFTTFVPGAERGYFLVVACLASAGLIVPQRRYRVAAGFLVFLSLVGACYGHIRGVEYRERLNEIREMELDD